MQNAQLDDPLDGLAARRKEASARSADARKIAPRTIAPHTPIDEPGGPVAVKAVASVAASASIPSLISGRPVVAAARSLRGQALRLSIDEERRHLTVDIRRPLDDALAELVPVMRQRGQRTSKAELVEMLLWELAQTDADDALAQRMTRFRDHAPR